MSNPNVTLMWEDLNMIENGHRVYRSKTPMDINNMPLPTKTLGKNLTVYEDNDVIDGEYYYYIVSAFTDKYEEFSNEIYTKAASTRLYVSGTGGLQQYSVEGIYNTDFSSVEPTGYLQEDNMGNFVTNSGDILYRINGNNGTPTALYTFSSMTSYDADDTGFYITSSSYSIIKYDYDGNEIYRHNINAYRNSATVSNDVLGEVLVADSDYPTFRVRRLDANGNQVWEASDSNQVRAIANKNGVVYYGGAGRKLFKVDYYTGIREWSLGTEFVWRIEIDVNDDVIVAFLNATIQKYKPDGSLIFTINAADRCMGLTSDKFGNIYIALRNGFIEKYSSEGNIIWSYDTAMDACYGIIVK